MQEEKSVGVVVFKENEKREYLLLKYEAGHWGFPKGHIEEGESEKETGEREVAEETGIENLTWLGEVDEMDYWYRREGESIHKLVAFWLALTQQEKVELSHEHVDFSWLPYEQALEKLTFEDTKDILKKAKKKLKGNQKRLNEF